MCSAPGFFLSQKTPQREGSSCCPKTSVGPDPLMGHLGGLMTGPDYALIHILVDIFPSRWCCSWVLSLFFENQYHFYSALWLTQSVSGPAVGHRRPMTGTTSGRCPPAALPLPNDGKGTKSGTRATPGMPEQFVALLSDLPPPPTTRERTPRTRFSHPKQCIKKFPAAFFSLRGLGFLKLVN